MKSWVFTAFVEPPVNETVSARFGASAFFAAYSRWTGWRMLVPGVGEEVIEEPQMLYLDDDYVRTHRRDLTQKHFKIENPFCLRKEKSKQLSLF